MTDRLVAAGMIGFEHVETTRLSKSEERVIIGHEHSLKVVRQWHN